MPSARDSARDELGEPVRRKHGIATRRLLIEVALELIHRNGVENFNLDEVLRVSGAARSSLYHHFGNKGGLLAAVATYEFELMGSRDNQLFRSLADKALSSADVRTAIQAMVSQSLTPQRKLFREAQVRIYHLSQDDFELRNSIAKMSNGQIAYLADSLDILQTKGIVALQSDATSIARWIVSQFFGRVIIDIAEANPSADEFWLNSTVSILCELMGLQ